MRAACINRTRLHNAAPNMTNGKLLLRTLVSMWLEFNSGSEAGYSPTAT
jgi:hypothetical protein